MKPVWSYDGDNPVAAKVVFDDREYQYARSIETVLSRDYVPDWNIAKAVKESIQNQLDESFRTNTLPVVEAELSDDGDTLVLRDRGEGVTLNLILLLGQSGKRGDNQTVGEHGEGEIISFLVCARDGVRKIMASQNWLITGRLAPYAGESAPVLILDVYERADNRPGTVWFYQGEGAAHGAYEAYQAFVRHFTFVRMPRAWESLRKALGNVGWQLPPRPAASNSPLITDERGNIYSRGQLVTQGLYRVACSYNLSTSPGRDRSGFVWDSIAGECAAIFAAHANADAIYMLLDMATRWGTNCAEFDFAEGPNRQVVLAGLRRFLRRSSDCSTVCWAKDGALDAPYIADGKMLPGVKVLTFWGQPPAWLTDVMPHVSIVTGQRLSRIVKPLPVTITKAASVLLSLCEHPEIAVEGRALTGDCYGASDRVRILLDPMKCRAFTWDRFVVVVVHEAAHVTSGSPDCTRSHTAEISKLSARIMENVVADAQAYKAARAAFQKWSHADKD